jgi:hypothetical protein
MCLVSDRDLGKPGTLRWSRLFHTSVQLADDLVDALRRHLEPSCRFWTHDGVLAVESGHGQQYI